MQAAVRQKLSFPSTKHNYALAKLLRAQMEFAAELESLATRRRSLEASLRDSSATLADAEAEVAETRMQSLGLRAQLEVLEAARDEIAAQEHQASMQQREEVKRLESLAANLASEAKEISQRHVKVTTSLQDGLTNATDQGKVRRPRRTHWVWPAQLPLSAVDVRERKWLRPSKDWEVSFVNWERSAVVDWSWLAS
ncbi:unnamed protein product [Durusdinium trenchii]|uniref:Uncharacterized protein n=1 Tax=Durusdinium trenchii TaxID=1381693 RepID=A0ABP0KAS3_9DINO